MAKLKSYVCVYLVLEDDDKILLSLRQNTNYEDGNWSMVAGHAEDGEMARESMIREAKEEVDITISSEDLTCVYVMDRKSPNRQNIDIFFKCSKYHGALKNNEPEKCGGIQYFDKKNLPDNIVDYVRVAIGEITKGKTYGEYS